MTRIDRHQIPTPQVQLTDEAAQQLKLIVENDITVKGKVFRLLITGKGCDGFTYSAGFSEKADDILIENPITTLAMDPFTAFYLQKVSIAHVTDFEQNIEGFVITNHDQNQFAGKFWRQNADKTPPLTD